MNYGMYDIKFGSQVSFEKFLGNFCVVKLFASRRFVGREFC